MTATMNDTPEASSPSPVDPATPAPAPTKLKKEKKEDSFPVFWFPAHVLQCEHICLTSLMIFH